MPVFLSSLRLPFISLAGTWLILCAACVPPLPALWWAAWIVYPAWRWALHVGGERVRGRHAVPFFGSLVVLWALGAPRAALLLAVCAVLGALAGGGLNRIGVALSAHRAALVFLGGALGWWGLPVWVLVISYSQKPKKRQRAAAWIVGIGLAWGVYVPALSLWSLVDFVRGGV